MKKYFIFAAAAVTFAACTEDVLIDSTKAPENNNEVAIGFGSDINKLVMTRADEDHAENSDGKLGDNQGLENYHKSFRIWGYKNIKNASTNEADPTTYTSTAVFDGTYSTTDGNKYKNSIATWSEVANNTEPFYTATDKIGDWVYSPVRYWDKTAYNYDFHAAAPDKYCTIATGKTEADAIDWRWNQKNKNSTASETWSYNKADAEGAGYFTLGELTNEGKVDASKDFELVGESLPLANATSKTDENSKKNVTTAPDEVFTKDVDLMIAKDVVKEDPRKHKSGEGNNGRVTFNFNHILSRLNIGVKIDGVAIKYKPLEVTVKNESATQKLYVKKNNTTEYYYKTSDDKAQKVKEEDGTYSKEGDASEDWVDADYKQVDDETQPTEGVVLLESIDIINLVTNGCFDEGVLAWSDETTATAMNGKTDRVVTPTQLVKGTNLRWTLGDITTKERTDSKINNYGFPNVEVKGTEDGDTETSLNLSKKFTVEGETDDDDIEYTKKDFKMVFQGLVIPQVAKYESIAVDGSDLGTTAIPYIKIVYTLDGEKYTNYYNLAEVFSNVQAQYTIQDEEDTPNTYKAYKTTAGSYAYQKEGATDGKWYNEDFHELTLKGYKDGDKYYGTDKKETSDLTSSTTLGEKEIILLCEAGEKGADAVYPCTPIPVTRGEATEADVTDECNITFCEGWQNNLWITINPVAILFDANVYKWDTKEDSYGNGTDPGKLNIE